MVFDLLIGIGGSVLDSARLVLQAGDGLSLVVTESKRVGDETVQQGDEVAVSNTPFPSILQGKEISREDKVIRSIFLVLVYPFTNLSPTRH